MRKSLLWTVYFVFIFGAGLGCTRKSDNNSVRVTVPINQKIGALVNYSLDIAIINVQIPGRPALLIKKEFHDSATAVGYGTSITFEVPNVPNGVSVFIQALNVYKGDATGDMKFYYDDAAVTVSGVTDVNISVKPSGTSNGKEAQIAGRYLTSNSGGPSGTLAIMFEPGNGKPAMVVEREAIVNGWFEGFAVQGANFDFLVEETGFKLFDDLTITAGGALQHIGGTVSFNTNRLNMLKPAGFRKKYGSSDVEPEPETQMILGFFDNNSDVFVNAVSRKVVYPTGSEGVPNAFVDAALTTIQDYTGASGSGSNIRNSAGGTGASFDNVYTLSGSGCSPAEFASGTCLIFYHAKMANNGREGFTGMKLPFRVVDALSPYGGYVRSKFKYNGCSGAHCIDLKWDLLPGTAAVIDGIDVWRKYSTDSSGGDERNLTCGDLKGKGFGLVGIIAAPAVTQNFEFSGEGLSQSNYNNFQFYLCARVNTDAGPRYLGEPARAECSGGCGEGLSHLGWSVSGPVTISTGTAHGNYKRIIGGIDTTDAKYTQFDVTPTHSFVAGDEVLIHVSGMTTSGTCGSENGNQIQPSRYSFARVVGTFSVASIRITKGSVLEAVEDSGVTDAILSNAPSSTFCMVQVVKVLHYNNLTINSSAGIFANNFSFATGGGILPVRVSGTLTMSGSGFLRATGAGYAGGAGTYHGAGPFGETNQTAASEGAGARGTATGGKGGGGGGYGKGGKNSAGQDGAAGNGMVSGGDGQPRLLFGGGGGGDDASSAGNNGGGAVFVMANKVAVANSTGNYIDASPNASANSGNGGAGGGGSVFFFARKLDASGPSGALDLKAKGGSSFGGIQGGKGGGGYVANLICGNSTPDPVTVTKSVIKGAVGADTNGGSPAQDGSNVDWNPTQYWWLCGGI